MTSIDIGFRIRVTRAYHTSNVEEQRQLALESPGAFLQVATDIGVEMRQSTRLWLAERAAELAELVLCRDPECYGLQPQIIGGPHAHEYTVDKRDKGCVPWRGPVPKPTPPPARPKPSPSPEPSPPPPVVERRRCRDCGDFVSSPRDFINAHYVRCARCRRAYAEAAELRAQEPIVYRCLCCGREMDEPVSVCQGCKESDRYREPAPDTPGLHRDGGGWPHIVFHTNARGESVVGGRVLPHSRYGESVWDRFGDTPEEE